MTTAKELARKAYCDAVKAEREGFFNNFSPEDRFEQWWSEWFHSNDHKNCFYDKGPTVFIDLKKYIKAE